jgi:ribose/xylose/arabinose/galactoside ABC-type transport system permease subunit
LVAVFAITALGGGLLSYGLAAASPMALADTLVPGAAAAILGGVSLSGGKGRPLGSPAVCWCCRCCAPV